MSITVWNHISPRPSNPSLRFKTASEAHALTGEMDYMLKVVTADLKALSGFVNDILLPHESVRHVKSAIVLETLKDTHALPLD